MIAVKNVYFIGCGVLGPDVNHLSEKLGITLIKKMLPGGLHNQPDELRRRLQLAIDEAAEDESCERIIVGYGLCGKGAVGIHAPHIPLVFPKVHDCIALFLGSDQAYKDEFARFPGTYYLSAGWYTEKTQSQKGKPDQVWVGSKAMGCKELTDMYGEKGGKEIIDFCSSWQQNYQRAAFIDTGIGNVERPAKHAREMAEKYNWQYQKIKGSLSLMTRLLTATESDEQILVVPANYVTTYSVIGSGLDAAPKSGADMSESAGTRRLVFDESEDRGLEIQYGLGIDAGGTYTDAAIYDFKKKELHSKNKALTTKWDFSIGIDQAIDKLDKDVLAQVNLVSISTTLATNAIVEAEGQMAGLFLMCGDAGLGEGLLHHSPRAVIKGRLNIQGKELEPVDQEEIRRKARRMIEQGVAAFAVSGYAGIMNPVHELEVKKILKEETGMVVTCGHELSSLLNFVVRAQTAVLNARIIQRMIKFFEEIDQVLQEREIYAPVMVVKGDGTLMSSAMARERPVETILSGPAASVAGAKMLTGLENATVVDIGGTTTDTADLVDGVVDVCAGGARVGNIGTHVKALNMQTVGLGGDSLIQWENGQLRIGPRRVAPVVWADAETTEGISEAMEYMETTIRLQPHSQLSTIILVAMKGEFPFTPTREEERIYQFLQERPYGISELATPLGLLSAKFLSTARLEASGLVQRCGLTPTDILHYKDQFVKWQPDAARRMVAIVAGLSGKSEDEFVEVILRRFEKELARELLVKQLRQDVSVDMKTETPLSTHLIDCMLSRNKGRYSLSATLEHPVIGIGAPVHYFLPDAGKRLHARVIIPKDADVANALGAICSHIMIKQQVTIRPTDTGRFWVDGFEGNRRFRHIEEAESWAVDQLKNKVQKMAEFAGTSRKMVEMEIDDHIIKVADGTPLFLGRSLLATLSGSPDLILESVLEN